MSASAFAIDLRCSNCGCEWNEELEARVNAEQDYRGVWVHPEDCYAHLRVGTCQGRRLRCPTCDLPQHVRVTDRRPLSAIVAPPREAKVGV